jgi:hypothetical protein
MADSANEKPNPTPAQQEPPARPAPPAYEPDTDLIGYIERGQKPPEKTRYR